MKHIPRKRQGLRLLTLVLATTATIVYAAEDAYPKRPIQVLVPFAAGGGLDLNARRFSQELAKQLGTSVAVVNRDGAAGTIGMQQLARANADGYTLVFSPAVPLTSEPHRLNTLAYRLDAFQPICQVFDNIFGVMVPGKSPLTTMDQLVARAKKEPQALRYGTSGTGSIAHLGIADVEQASQTQFTHVPYKGDGPMMQDLLAERLDFGAMLVSSVSQHIKNGSMKLVAVYSAKRHPAFPDVPTLVEAGIPVEQASFGGLLAPAKTPAAVVQTLEKACQQATSTPSYAQWALQNNQLVDYQNSSDFGKRLTKDSQLKQATIQRLGLNH